MGAAKFALGFGSGLGSLIGMGLSDVLHGAVRTLTDDETSKSLGFGGSDYHYYLESFLPAWEGRDLSQQHLGDRLKASLGVVGGIVRPDWATGASYPLAEALWQRYSNPIDSFKEDPYGMAFDTLLITSGLAGKAAKLADVRLAAEVSALSAAGDVAGAAQAASRLGRLGREVKWIRDQRLAREAIAAGQDTPSVLRASSDFMRAAAGSGPVIKPSMTARVLDKLAYSYRPIIGYPKGSKNIPVPGAEGIYLGRTTKNPILRALFQKPLDRISLEEVGALKQRLGLEREAAIKAQNVEKVREIDARLGLIDHWQGTAMSPGFGVNLKQRQWFFERRAKLLTDRMVGVSTSNFYDSRNDVFREIGAAIDDRLSQESYDAAADWMIGARGTEHLLDRLPRADLEPLVQSAGFSTLEEAGRGVTQEIARRSRNMARFGRPNGTDMVGVTIEGQVGAEDAVIVQMPAMEAYFRANPQITPEEMAQIRSDAAPAPRVAQLDHTVQASIRKMIADGQIVAFDPLDYIPPPEVAALPQRQALLARTIEAMQRAGIPDAERESARFVAVQDMFAQLSARVAERMGEPIDLGKHYDDLMVRYQEKYIPVRGEKLSLLTGNLDMEAAARKIVELLQTREGMKAYRWYKDANALEQLFRGVEVKLLSGKSVPLWDYFADVLGVTSAGVDPKDQMLAALQIAKWMYEGKIVEKMFAGREVGITFDNDPAIFGDSAGKTMFIGQAAGSNINDVRELSLGWGTQDWTREGLRNSYVDLQKQIAALKADPKARKSTIATKERLLEKTLMEAKRFGVDVTQPVEVPWEVIELRLRTRLAGLEGSPASANRDASIKDVLVALDTKTLSPELAALKSIRLQHSSRLKERSFGANVAGDRTKNTADRRDMVAKGAVESKRITGKKNKKTGEVTPSQYERVYGEPPPKGLPTEANVPGLMAFAAPEGGVYYLMNDLTDQVVDLVNAILLDMGDAAPLASAEVAGVQSVIWHEMQKFMRLLTAREREFLAKSSAKVFVDESGKKWPRETIQAYINALDLTPKERPTVNYLEAMFPVLSQPALRDHFAMLFNREYLDRFLSSPDKFSEHLQTLAGKVIGRYLYGEDAQRVIEFLEGATATTPSHEIGHQLEDILRNSMPTEHALLTMASRGVSNTLFTRRGMQEFIERSLAEKGGTIDVITGERPKTGYAVARKPQMTTGLVSGEEVNTSVLIDPAQLSVDNLLDYAVDRGHLFVQSVENPGVPAAWLGLWVDEPGNWFVDVADVMGTYGEAAGAAVERNQKGIWDVVGNGFIETGGTGGNPAREFTPLDRDQRTAAAARLLQGDVGGTTEGTLSRLGGGSSQVSQKWTIEQHEWFADQLEKYRVGEEVNPIVRDILETFFKDANDLFPGSARDTSILYGGLDRPYREINLPGGLLTEGEASELAHAIPKEVLSSVARAAARPIGSALREMFGHKFVKTRVKGAEALRDSADLAGGVEKVTDLLGHRVILGSWRDVDAAVAQLKARFTVHAIEDLRPGVIHTPWQEFLTARDSGYRGVRVYIEDPRYPGLISEIELGTALFDQTRNASALAGRILRRGRALAKQVKEAVNAGEASIDDLEEVVQLLEAHRLRITGIWEYLADELDSHLNGVTMIDSPERATQEAMRLIIARQFEESEIAAGLGPEVLFERQYLERRRASGARWSAKDMNYVDGRSAIELAQEDARLGRPQPVYFPEMDLRKHRLSDFLGPSRRKIGAAFNYRKTYLNRNRSIVRNSEGGIWEKPEQMRDMKQVYQIRSAKSLKTISALKFAEELFKTFARPVESSDQVGITESVMSFDHIREIVNRQIDFDEAYAEALGQIERHGLSAADTESLFDTKDWPEDVLATLKETMESGTAEQKAMLHAISVSIMKSNRRLAATAGKPQLYAIPRVVAKRIEDSVLPTSIWGRLLVDTPNQLWRTMTLALVPRWIMNNVIGNSVSAVLQGAKFSDMVRYILDKDFRELVQELAPEGTLGGFFKEQASLNRNLGVAANSPIGRLYAIIANNKFVHALGAPARGMMWINSVAEDASRAASFLKAVERQRLALKLKRLGTRFWTSKQKLEQLLVEGMSEGAARAALDEVNYFLNDYRTLSPWEKKWMRRVIAPFWSFHKHMTRLAVTYPFEYPMRALLIKNLADFANDMQDEYGPVPTWLETAIPFGPGKDGKQRFLNTRGPNPFSGLMEGPLGLLHPGLKVMFEWLTGRSTYTGREFTDENTVEDFVTRMKFRFERNADGTYSVEQVDKVRPSIPEMLLQQFPQYNLAKDLIAGANTYDTATLLDVIQGRGIIRDRETGEPISPYDALQILMKYFGISTTDYDIQKFQNETYPEALNRSVKSYLQRVTGA